MLSILKDRRIWIPSIAFLALLLFGFFRIGPSILVSPDSFIENLLSEGLGVVVSTIVIAPLTAYYVERRRELQLRSIRRQLLTRLARMVGQLIFGYQQRLGDLSMAKTLLQALDFTQSSKLLRLLNLHQQDTAPKPEDSAGEQKLIAAAWSLASATRSIAELKNDSRSLEQVIDIFTPFVDTEMLDRVIGISDSIEQQLNQFRYLRNYLAGTATFLERGFAKAALLDTKNLLQQVDLLLESSGNADLKKFVGTGRDCTVDNATQSRIIQDIAPIIDKLFYSEMVEKYEGFE